MSNITRISLYPHELKTIAELTVELARLRQNECNHLCIENVGPEIFGKLVQILYGPIPYFAKPPSPDWLQQMEGIQSGGGGYP